MDKEIIETVLTELVSNSEATNQKLDNLSKEVSVNSSMIKHQEIKSLPPDTSELKEMLNDWAKKYDEKLALLPRKHSIRLLLFPEENTTNYLKTLWKISLKWILFIILVLCTYRLCEKWLDKAYTVNQYKNAWESVYGKADKRGKKIMEQELQKYYE